MTYDKINIKNISVSINLTKNQNINEDDKIQINAIGASTRGADGLLDIINEHSSKISKKSIE